MANKKILCLEDLVKFFEENKLNSFSSKEAGYQLAIQVPAELTFKEDDSLNNSGMLYCKLRVCHTNLNRNGSFISEENMKKALPSLKYRPLLAHIHQLDDGSWDFHSHDMEITEDGVDYIEKQIGAFTADEPYLEYDKNMDKTYVIAYAAIPEDYTMAADIIRSKNGTVVSCELSIETMAYNAKEKYLELQDFYFSGCACLGSEKNGKEIQPGMEGARLDIVDFSQENNSLMNYSDNKVNIKLIETLEALSNTLSKFNINQEDIKSLEIYGKEENGSMNEEIKVEEEVTEVEAVEETAEEVAEVVEENNEEVVEKTTEVAENEVTETEEFTEEVAETETDETVEEGTPEVGEEETNEAEEGTETVETETENYSSMVKYSVESKGEVKTYEVSLDEKIYAIQDLVNITYGESDNTYYGVKVYEDYVIMLDYWSGKAYKQQYSTEEDSYVLTGDRVEVYSVWVTAEEEAVLNDMKSNYASLVQFKEDTENAQLHTQRESILYNEKYSVLAEKDENNEYKNEAYAKLVSEMDNYSLTDLEKELKSVFADYITNGGQFAYTGESEAKPMVTKKLFTTTTSKKSSRYGNLFNK